MAQAAPCCGGGAGGRGRPVLELLCSLEKGLEARCCLEEGPRLKVVVEVLVEARFLLPPPLSSRWPGREGLRSLEEELRLEFVANADRWIAALFSIPMTIFEFLCPREEMIRLKLVAAPGLIPAPLWIRWPLEFLCSLEKQIHSKIVSGVGHLMPTSYLIQLHRFRGG